MDSLTSHICVLADAGMKPAAACHLLPERRETASATVSHSRGFHCGSTLGNPEVEPGAGRGLESRSVFPWENQNDWAWVPRGGDDGLCKDFPGRVPRGGGNLPQAPQQWGQRGCDAAWRACVPKSTSGALDPSLESPTLGNYPARCWHDPGTESRRTRSSAQLRCPAAVHPAARRPTVT